MSKGNGCSESIVSLFAIVAIFLFFTNEIDYLEYDCVREDFNDKVKMNVKIFKEHIVFQNVLDDGREIYFAYECKNKEDSDYYKLRYCGNEHITINKRDNTYTSRNKAFSNQETWAIRKGYCKKKNIFTRLVNGFVQYQKEKGFKLN